MIGCFFHMSFKWTRGESNPCPKAYSPRFLPSQSVICYSLCDAPTDRLIVSVASYFYFRLKALPKEFPTWMTPVTGKNPVGPCGFSSCAVGYTGPTCCTLGS